MMKKYFSLAIVLILMLALAVPAFADDPDDKCLPIPIEEIDADFVVFSDISATGYNPGDTISISIMLFGKVKPYALTDIKVEYDNNLLEYSDYQNLNAWDTQIQKAPPNGIITRSAANIDMRVGKSCNPAEQLLTLEFKVKDTITAADLYDILGITTAVVYPPSGTATTVIVPPVQYYEHIWVAQNTVAPTCLEEGYTHYKCDRCHKEKDDDFVDALGHDWGDWEITKYATCMVGGEETRICKRDPSHIETRDTTVVQDAHKWGDWVVTTDATCSATGIETRTCEYNAAHTETRVLAIDPDAHAWTVTVVPPTCTEKGYTEHICGNDATHNFRDNYVDETGHTWDNGVVTKAATCEEDGEMTYTCTVCGDKKTEVISKTGHAWTVTVIPPTCLLDGYTKHECGNDAAHNYEDTPVPALDHDFSVLVDHKDATCVEDGHDIFKCSRCDVTNTVVLTDPDNHIGPYRKVVTFPPTCLTVGTASIICNACDHVTDIEDVPKVDHFYDTYTIITKDGVQGYECVWCHDFIPLEDILKVDGIIVLKDPAFGGNHGNLLVILPDKTEIKIPQSALRTPTGGTVSNNYNGVAMAQFVYGDYKYEITLTFRGQGNGGSDPWRVTHASLRVIEVLK